MKTHAATGTNRFPKRQVFVVGNGAKENTARRKDASDFCQPRGALDGVQMLQHLRRHDDVESSRFERHFLDDANDAANALITNLGDRLFVGIERMNFATLVQRALLEVAVADANIEHPNRFGPIRPAANLPREPAEARSSRQKGVSSFPLKVAPNLLLVEFAHGGLLWLPGSR